LILIDANLLLYAYNASSEHHVAARAWLEKAFSGPQPVRLAWMTLLAFLRIGTNSRVFPHPLTVREAVDMVSVWLTIPAVAILDPGDGHWEILAGLITTNQASGPLVMDAHDRQHDCWRTGGYGSVRDDRLALQGVPVEPVRDFIVNQLPIQVWC